MTTLHPGLDRLDELVEPLDDARLDVARALDALGDGWAVYVRPRLGLDVPDFLAVHDEHGACAIVVREWTPDTHRIGDDGGLERRNGDGWTVEPDRPRNEAARLRASIYDQFYALPDDDGAPTPCVRAVVILPSCPDLDTTHLLPAPAEDADDAEAAPPELDVAVIGRDTLAGGFEAALQRAAGERPSPPSMRRLRQLVVPSERRRGQTAPVRLTADARMIADNPSGALIRRVKGPAGSGKTFGLAARAALLASTGRSVLLLSFNVTLAHELRALATARCHELGANPTLVTGTNFHSFCTRVVQDAEARGMSLPVSSRLLFADRIVAKARQAFEQGFERRYDAVLVDEGQDFTLDWWELLRAHVVATRDGAVAGEMVLAVDPTQDVYARQSWNDELRMGAAGFAEPWIELSAGYRMPVDLIAPTNRFAAAHVPGARLHATRPADLADIHGSCPASVRHWLDVERVADLGSAVGREVVRLLHEHPSLAPRDVVFLCEYHHDGVAAVAEIEAAGIPVHHIFSRDPDAPRRRRKHRFWPEADAVKGCTPHSFKGWGTPAAVVGIGVEKRSRQLAYVSMTRVAARPSGDPSFVSIINADRSLAGFKAVFEAPPATDSVVAAGPWSPPVAAARVG